MEGEDGEWEVFYIVTSHIPSQNGQFPCTFPGCQVSHVHLPNSYNFP